MKCAGIRKTFTARRLAVIGLSILMVASVLVLSNRTRNLVIEGGIDIDTYRSVKAAVADARTWHQNLRVEIASPGGSALMGVDIARQLRDYSDSGAVVEVHATALCASACTLVLASGTPGYRYIEPMALFLVHPLQSGGYGGMTCNEKKGDLRASPDRFAHREQDDRVADELRDMLRDSYVRFTGRPAAVVEGWLHCGGESIGRGQMAVDMGIADKIGD